MTRTAKVHRRRALEMPWIHDQSLATLNACLHGGNVVRTRPMTCLAGHAEDHIVEAAGPGYAGSVTGKTSANFVRHHTAAYSRLQRLRTIRLIRGAIEPVCAAVVAEVALKELALMVGDVNLADAAIAEHPTDGLSGFFRSLANHEL